MPRGPRVPHGARASLLCGPLKGIYRDLPPHIFIFGLGSNHNNSPTPGDPGPRHPGDPGHRRPGTPGPRGPGTPGTRDPGDPGDPGTRDPGIREGPGRSREDRGQFSEFLALFLPETGYSDAGARILAKNYIYGLQDHRKWMKVDPFRAHLKFRKKELDGVSVI